MDECLQILGETKECPNDEILVQQVRLRLIVEKTFWETSFDVAVDSTEHAREPSSLCLEALGSQLQDIKSQLLTQTQTDGKLSRTSQSMSPS